MIIVLGIGIFIISMIVRNRFKSVMKRLGSMGTQSGLTGREIAERMLRDYGIYDVEVISTRGMLTDHYNPLKKTVNLSEAVYNQRSIAAAAVAAHECGHAVQHAKQYAFLQVRSGLVPVVNIASRIAPWIILAGIFTIQTFPQLMLLGIILFGASTLFSFLTLPVEFDASKRALAWLDRSGLTQGREHEEAEKGLNWAAMTYVVAALGSLATLLYYVLIFMGASSND